MSSPVWVPTAPWGPEEIRAAVNRPPRHRVSMPEVGSAVCYRHEHWGPVSGAKVVGVEDLDDYGDHYVWRVVTDGRGHPVIDGVGRRCYERIPDPWVTLRVATDWGLRVTREARLRGSAGWLPADWRSRWYPAPGGVGWMREAVTGRG